MLDPDLENCNAITGQGCTDRGEKIWHIFCSTNNRYVGSTVSTWKLVFRYMDTINSKGNLTALTAEDIRKGCFTEDGKEWTKAYKDMMEGVIIFPAYLLEAVTAQQSFRKWLKTIA